MSSKPIRPSIIGSTSTPLTVAQAPGGSVPPPGTPQRVPAATYEQAQSAPADAGAPSANHGAKTAQEVALRTGDLPDATVLLDELSAIGKARHREQRITMSYNEWLNLARKDPTRQFRSAAQYLLAALEHYGSHEKSTPGGQARRFNLFDQSFNGEPVVRGLENAQNELYKVISDFVAQGFVNKVVTLRGPRGSGKDSLLAKLEQAMAAYSRTPEGAQYTFYWDLGDTGAKRRAGFGNEDQPSLVTAGQPERKVRDGVRDHPALLLPREERMTFLERVKARFPGFTPSDRISRNSLSDLNQRVYDALYAKYDGDFSKIIQHVRVERFFHDPEHGVAAVSVTQPSPDAAEQAVTPEQPNFDLIALLGTDQAGVKPVGPLANAHRGTINFVDLFQRQPPLIKYLNTVAEVSEVSLPHVQVRLDTVFLATSNELDRSIRARDPELASMLSRTIEIICPLQRVYTEEAALLSEQLDQKGTPLAPHVAELAALIAVATRMRKPELAKQEEAHRPLAKRVANSPVQKAELYAGIVPKNMAAEDRSRLREVIRTMWEEPFAPVGAESGVVLAGGYEGAFGIDSRELPELVRAAGDPKTRRVTAPALLEHLRETLGTKSQLLDASAGYHDVKAIVAEAEQRWLDWTERDFLGALELVEGNDLEQKLATYVRHVKASSLGEKVHNPITGQDEAPSNPIMDGFEALIGADGKTLRQRVMAEIANWKLANPDKTLDGNLQTIFTREVGSVRKKYTNEHRATVAHAIQYVQLRTKGNSGDAVVFAHASERAAAERAYQRLTGRDPSSPAGSAQPQPVYRDDELGAALDLLRQARYA